MQPGLPIGVFDSGIGGLTVVDAISRRLPQERIVYFGDTARCPYGDRTPAEVLTFSREICHFLVRTGVKLLVVACNTATAAALPVLQAEMSVPVIGVVAPGARAAAGVSAKEKIGVIGTAVTIASGAYEREVRALLPRATVYSLACPRFVPLVEQGETESETAKTVVEESLEPLSRLQLDSLILGCTHYPHLQSVIQAVMGPKVALISSAEETAIEVERLLDELHLKAGAGDKPEHVYYTTGDGERMKSALERWFNLEEQRAPVISVQLEAVPCEL